MVSMRCSGAEASHVLNPCGSLPHTAVLASTPPPRISLGDCHTADRHHRTHRVSSGDNIGESEQSHLPKIMEDVPAPGQWPVAPQDDQDIRKDRLWVDGCFDFAHHGTSQICHDPRTYLTSHQVMQELCCRAVNKARSCGAAFTPTRPSSRTRARPS